MNDKRLSFEDRMKAQGAVASLLTAFGVPGDEHTLDTPRRVVKAWEERLAGYLEDPSEHLEVTFPAPERPGLIIARHVRIQSTCAHHLLPIEGEATIAYRPRPGQSVVGLSKLSRLAEGYSRRLQVQEAITADIVTALSERLNPMWAACSITATHGCMTMRGIRDACSDTLTYNDTGEPTESDRAAFWAAVNSR